MFKNKQKSSAQRKTKQKPHTHGKKHLATTNKTKKHPQPNSTITTTPFLHRQQKRNVSIFDSPLTTQTTPGQSVQFSDPMDDKLQAEIDESIADGTLDLSEGKVVFDARASNHHFLRYRVVSHLASAYTNKEERIMDQQLEASGHQRSAKKFDDKIYYSFQQLYDDGEEEFQQPYTNIRSVVTAGSDNISNLNLPSSAAIINALNFAPHAPQKALYIGGWGGVIPHYLAKRVGTDVEIVDSDTMSMYMSKCYSPNIFFDDVGAHGSILNAKEKIRFAEELPDHPFDIIFDHKAKQLSALKQLQGGESGEQDEVDQLGVQDNIHHQDEMDDAHMEVSLQHSITAFQQARMRNQNSGQVTYHPSAVDAESLISSLFSHRYLNKQGGVEAAIDLLQKTKHLSFLKKQKEQTYTHLYALALDKFNIKELIQADVNSEVYNAKIKLAEVENKLKQANADFAAAKTVKDKQDAQLHVELYSTQVKQLTQVVSTTTITKQQEHQMVEKVLKWIHLRLQGLEEHNNTLEIWGGDEEEVDNSPEAEAERRKKQQEKEAKNNLLTIFADDELCFANKFNKRFFEVFVFDPTAEGSAEMMAMMEENGEDVGDMTKQAENLDDLYEGMNNIQGVDCVWFQTSFHTLDGYTTAIAKHQDDVEQLKKILQEEHKITEDTLTALASIHETILDSVYLPMKGYDLIVHDQDSDKISDETLQRVKEVLFTEGDDESIRHGVFVKRMSIASPEVKEEFSMAFQDWMGDVNVEAERLRKAFAHVYWSQPSLDSVVFAATDGPLCADGFNKHPIDPDTAVDSAVQLWQNGAIGLDVVEQSDRWNYIGKQSDPTMAGNKAFKIDVESLLIFDPEEFHADNVDELL